MNKLIDVFKRIKPDCDEKELLMNESLVSSGYLDSFDIVMLVSEINKTYNIVIPIDELTPENFESIDMIHNMVCENINR